MDFTNDFSAKTAYKYSIPSSYTGRMPDGYINHRSDREEYHIAPDDVDYDCIRFSHMKTTFLPIDMSKKPHDYDYTLVPLLVGGHATHTEIALYLDRGWTLVPRVRHQEFKTIPTDLRRVLSGLKLSHLKSKYNNIEEEELRAYDDLYTNCIVYKNLILMERPKYISEREMHAIKEREKKIWDNQSPKRFVESYRRTPYYKVSAEIE